MEVTVLKDFLIGENAIDRYFGGRVPVNLWRAMKRTDSRIFQLVEEPFLLSNGRVRPTDITIEQRNGVRWVLVKPDPRGASTFDRAGLPPGKDWSYFRIPQGTVLPPDLAIVRDAYRERWAATHYTIAPAHDMPLDTFKFLLDEFAKRCAKETA